MKTDLKLAESPERDCGVALYDLVPLMDSHETKKIASVAGRSSRVSDTYVESALRVDSGVHDETVARGCR